eukprot:scaffold14375_cov65-Skeletonema_dohrnii-CCMP3373.AAC.1
MAPYSLSACQVVRVFCAVMRALGASPIKSLGIVFLAGVLAPHPSVLRTARHVASQRFLEEVFSSGAAATQNNHGEDGMSVRSQGNRRELISHQHVYLDPIATAQRVICGDFNVSS